VSTVGTGPSLELVDKSKCSLEVYNTFCVFFSRSAVFHLAS
jgi:hypothetical protein